MAVIQTQMIQFDDKIRLKRFEENKELREKRDIILDKLRGKFKAMREDEKKDVPTFDHLNQGSYEMGTGIYPEEGDYDIDVGLKFNCATTKYSNPVDLKILVADALEAHTKLGTEVRRSCVTVKYQKDGEQAFHVDLAVYAYDNPDSATKRLFIAKGKRGAGAEDRTWESSEPKELTNWVAARFSESEKQSQFLRVIRALKRWKTKKFKMDGQNAPSGIGLTVAAGLWFTPQVRTDALTEKTTVDDVKAMRDFVDSAVSRFTWVGVKSDGSALYRLVVPLPVRPGTDIFVKMSEGQMTVFRDRLIQLRDCLDKVRDEVDVVEACKRMQGQFGEDFPVPDKGSTGRLGGPAIVSSAVSA
ncbi:nucleotidyltransferase [Myxococcus sp. CA040A]|uniref:nucleotidyltransferase domain-containing protein n=1 Tax=Myxococcus sp. CA040A TaxID=2741738 RepID=UPI00157A27FD|nr:nucleotidyltransferase [Myxococcus sp. CA040A]NTX07576.1 nucleotidyltransferase [Myxococcus sp. CA040A]